MTERGALSPKGDQSPRNRRRLLWYALAIAAIPIALVLTLLIPDAAGSHADSHVFSATQYAVQALILVGLAVAVRGTLTRLSLATLVPLLAGVIYGAFASGWIAHLIWHKNWTSDNAGELGPSVAGFEHWHELAEQADMIVLGGGVAFAVTVLLSRRTGRVAPAVAIALSLIPAWIFPALGCSFLLAHVAASNTDKG